MNDDQGNLFDGEQAKAAGDSGMDKALHAERVEQWKLDADVWLEGQVTGREFTTDDLIRDIGPADFGANRNNVVGAWTNSKARAGVYPLCREAAEVGARVTSWESSARVAREMSGYLSPPLQKERTCPKTPPPKTSAA